MKQHQNRCAVQRDVVTATVNKTLFSLVYEQNVVLHSLNVPSFTFEMLQQLEHVSEDAHTYSETLNKQLEQQRRIVCALLWLRFNSMKSNSTIRTSSLPPNVDISMLSRGSSYSNEGSPDVSVTSSGKKRRRIIGTNAIPVEPHVVPSDTPGPSVAQEHNIVVGSPVGGGSVKVKSISTLNEIDFGEMSKTVEEPAVVQSSTTSNISSSDAGETPNEESSLPLLQKIALMLKNAKKQP